MRSVVTTLLTSGRIAFLAGFLRTRLRGWKQAVLWGSPCFSQSGRLPSWSNGEDSTPTRPLPRFLKGNRRGSAHPPSIWPAGPPEGGPAGDLPGVRTQRCCLPSHPGQQTTTFSAARAPDHDKVFGHLPDDVLRRLDLDSNLAETKTHVGDAPAAFSIQPRLIQWSQKLLSIAFALARVEGSCRDVLVWAWTPRSRA